MAEEISYDDAWWATHSWFTSNENFGDEMLRHANEAKIDDKQQLDPNMCDENQIEQPNDIIVSSHHDGEKEIQDGEVVKKRKGKAILIDGDVVMKRSRKGINGVIHKRKAKGKRYLQRCNNGARVSLERRRRTKEKKLYGELLALLPHLSVKDHKAKILKEAADSIKTLKETLLGLEKQKLERLYSASQSLVSNTESPNLLINKGDSVNLNNISYQSSNCFETYASSHVTLNVCGAYALISICSERIPELFTTICYIFEEHNMEVVYTEISSDQAKTMYLIRVRFRGNVPPEFAEVFPYEQTYYKAVAQIEKLVKFQN
ncbi:uncharacterized protein LOC110882447 [Helianthus annuus]|uniref:uncharacterized protein LOC110882447 n=1 Tax=Helianthus annuus TaxID=4232 RepID=UPI000B8FE9A9|nr:uncharacterized protein LOC110882447 [Helianthus annuus]